MTSWLLLLLGIVLNATAQLTLKLGLANDAHRPIAELLMNMPHILLRLPVLLGLCLYAASVVNWLLVLSRFELSVAYPLMSLGYILTWIYGMWIFNEPYAHTRLLGILVVICGIVLLTYPVKNKAGLAQVITDPLRPNAQTAMPLDDRGNTRNNADNNSDAETNTKPSVDPQ